MFNGFFTGINYWASKNATKMWQDFDEASIENDMRLLQSAGITALRIFPKWDDFQPITAFSTPSSGIFEYEMRGEARPDTEAGRAGVDEVMCERFERFCEIADKYGMKLTVGLLTGHMSFANFIPPALVNLNLVTDPIALRWEIRYMKYIVRRFAKIKAIVAWDLGNEINCIGPRTKDEFHNWCVMLSDAIKVCDPTRPVLSGVGGFGIDKGVSNLYDLSESCDMNTIHGYNIFTTATEPVNTMKPVLDYMYKCRVSEDISGMPSFIQEFGAIGYTNCSLKSEAEFYRATALSALGGGTCGIMYWCAFDQGHLTFPPYNWNNIGSDYGFFDRELKPKPIVKENLRIKELADKYGSKLTKPKSSCTIIIPRDEYEDSTNMTRAAYILAKRSGLEAGFCYAPDRIPDSDLYILPSVKFDKAITNTNLIKLLDKVKNGAVLYISLSRAYFRNVCSMAGVTVENMTVGNENREMVFEDGEELPIISAAKYEIIPEACEVLAKDKGGTPIFVKNKHGKGEIFFLFAPLEEYLANKKGAFYDTDTPNYERIYNEISRSAKKKLVSSDSKFILTTEHEDGDDRFILAVNYSNHKQSAELHAPEGYKLTALWGESFDGKKVTLEACDGILLKAAYSKENMQ